MLGQVQVRVGIDLIPEVSVSLLGLGRRRVQSGPVILVLAVFKANFHEKQIVFVIGTLILLKL